ncbi:MAG TPA: nitrilase-related carbon-nitrogen hydrolase [Aggregatilineales bacterium]|nr:nitrilase-related carbon-nitrogen hydrolase [Aggregatilineales bacterium]
MRIKLGVAQTDAVLGDVEANLARHLEFVKQAREQDVDLLVFPELSLTGYSLQDLTYHAAIRPNGSSEVFKPLLEASRDLDLVVGFVEEDPRHRYYIAAAYLSQGEVVHIHRKVYLPTYTLFEEGRFFALGEDIRSFETRFGRVGMLICEDFWHASPPYLAWLDGADILILTSASPGRGLDEGDVPASVRWVERVTQAYAGLFTTFVVHANRVGVEDGAIFYGGSLVYNPDGELVAKAPTFDEHLLTATLDLNQLRRARMRLPLLRDERAGLTVRTLQRILAERAVNTR